MTRAYTFFSLLREKYEKQETTLYSTVINWLYSLFPAFVSVPHKITYFNFTRLIQ